MSEEKRSVWIARRSSFPSPRMWLWPVYSARLRGRILAASGARGSTSPAVGKVGMAVEAKRSSGIGKAGTECAAKPSPGNLWSFENDQQKNWKTSRNPSALRTKILSPPCSRSKAPPTPVFAMANRAVISSRSVVWPWVDWDCQISSARRRRRGRSPSIAQ